MLIAVQKALAGEGYPCSKADLICTPQSNGADRSLLDDVGELSQQEYTGPDQVEKALF